VTRYRALPFENEQRALGKDGNIAGFSFSTIPCANEHGSVVRWYVTGRTLRIASRPNRGCAMKTWHCAKRLIVLRCTKQSLIVGADPQCDFTDQQVAPQIPRC